MILTSENDLAAFIAGNYFTFLLLAGLTIIMLAYRDIHLPATRNFQLIIAVILLMSISFSVERWASYSPDRINMRIIASVMHYILQPLVIYLELVIIMPEEDRKDPKNHFLLALPMIINTIIYLIAPFSGKLVFYFDEHYWFCRGMLGGSIYIVTFIYLTLLLIWSIEFFRDNDKRKSIILFFTAAIAVLTGILEGMNITPGYTDEAFALGVSLYYIYLITVHVSQVQAQLARKELELSENKIRLLRQQIRPHFIFNSLQIIKSLIRTNQVKAVECLEDFSDYLKVNFDVLTSDKLIPFDEELDHIEAYVSLALADNDKDIDVQYDIQEKYFMIPPLTIEPLVENAIVHGVRDGGTVILSTRADEKGGYVITVSDNGVGFKPEDVKTEMDHGSGVGITNVRTRLATLCNGTLYILGSANGTCVTVHIPARTPKSQNQDGQEDNQ